MLIRAPQIQSNMSLEARAKQLFKNNAYLSNNKGLYFNLIGDSISAGAYAGSAFTKHWVWLLARSIRAESSNKNSLGEYPLESLWNPQPELVTNTLADVEFSAAGWGDRLPNPAPYNYPIGRIGAAAADSLNGKTYYSTTAEAWIKVTVPTMSRAISFRYTQKPGAGRLKVQVNGVESITIDCAGAYEANKQTANIPLVDNGRGKCTIKIIKLDANETEINATYNLKTDSIDITDVYGRAQINVNAQPGRRLSDMSEKAIIDACNCVALVFSLGYNDVYTGTDTDDALFAQFKQRIDWFIKYAKVYKNLVVVQDFCWYKPKSSRTRQQLKRFADAVGGVYIPYPEQFFADRSNPTNGDNGTEITLNAPEFLWADIAHPNERGNNMIFSTLTAALGMSVCSVDDALKYHDWQYPLEIDENSGLINTSTQYPGSLSTVQRIGDEYFFRINVKTENGAPLPAAAQTIITDHLPMKFTGGKDIQLLNQDFTGKINYGTGEVDTVLITDAPQTVKIWTRTANYSSVESSFLVTEKT